MKKQIVAVILVIVFAIGAASTYKAVASNNIRNKTYEFLEAKGYVETDISSIEIKHSFLNKLLSYNEWRIFVVFESEPDVVFSFTYRNKEIIKQGVTGTPMPNKDEIREYSEMFDNGELKK